MIRSSLTNHEMRLREKLWQINWTMVLLIVAIACIGFAMLYSAAKGNFDPWASRQMGRFGIGLALMFVIALVDIRFWMRYALFMYLTGLALLGAVEIAGSIGMGAQRWLDLGFFRLQPSEFMKIAVILTLARHFHALDVEDIGRPIYLIIPFFIVAAPVALVLRQPDLGTSIMLVLGAGAMFFIVGVRVWKFVVVLVVGLASIPVVWNFLHVYQRKRILIFLNPESDPLGAGYHILQSKIALGSGSLFGKGFINGSQSHLEFLPERHTDFIFTMLAEEFGLVGGVFVILLYALLVIYGFAIAMRSRNHFGRLLAMGLTANLFLYVFVNIAMVMGVVPVVGVPLPLISYGGTAMISVLISFGLVLNVYVHRDVRIGRHWSETGV
ncbi:MAG: rod shape-determining protein RodA [Proteobacteria bacterium]|nr:rod shape-determining protein RodA [Pseudomonadota bacterium]